MYKNIGFIWESNTKQLGMSTKAQNRKKSSYFLHVPQNQGGVHAYSRVPIQVMQRSTRSCSTFLLKVGTTMS